MKLRDYNRSKEAIILKVFDSLCLTKLGSHSLYPDHIYSKFLFVKWSLENEDFQRTYEAYVESGYQKRYKPYVYVVRADLPRDLKNIKWISFAN